MSLSCTFLFNSLHHSSSHSLRGLPLVVFPSIFPNTTSFTSLLYSILQMWPNKFNFISLFMIVFDILLTLRILQQHHISNANVIDYCHQYMQFSYLLVMEKLLKVERGVTSICCYSIVDSMQSA